MDKVNILFAKHRNSELIAIDAALGLKEKYPEKVNLIEFPRELKGVDYWENALGVKRTRCIDFYKRLDFPYLDFHSTKISFEDKENFYIGFIRLGSDKDKLDFSLEDTLGGDILKDLELPEQRIVEFCMPGCVTDMLDIILEYATVTKETKKEFWESKGISQGVFDDFKKLYEMEHIDIDINDAIALVSEKRASKGYQEIKKGVIDFFSRNLFDKI